MRLNTRLPRRVRKDLELVARGRQIDESELASMLLDEGLRREKHPGIVFRDTASGREPAIEGRRLYVRQVMETVWASKGDIDEAASYLSLRPDQVRSAMTYYSEFKDEVDEAIDANQVAADRALGS